ncbi:hypothetical protein D3C71_1982950 [compost metagenome]
MDAEMRRKHAATNACALGVDEDVGSVHHSMDTAEITDVVRFHVAHDRSCLRHNKFAATDVASVGRRDFHVPVGIAISAVHHSDFL